MKNISKNRLLLLAVSLWLAFWPVMLFVSSKDLIEFLIGPIVTCCLGIVYIYWPGVKDALIFGRREMDHSDFIVLGVIFVFTSMAGRFAYSWWWRIFTDQDPKLLTNTLIAYFFWGTFTGVFLLLAAPRTIRNEAPRMNWARIIIIVSSGAILGTAAATIL